MKKRPSDSAVKTRHSVSHEPLLPIYIGLSIEQFEEDGVVIPVQTANVEKLIYHAHHFVIVNVTLHRTFY